MVKTLAADEIRNLMEAYSEARSCITSLRGRYGVSQHLKMPQIPRALSESLAALLISTGLVQLPKMSGQINSVERSGKQGDSDLLVHTAAGIHRVEVKASADKEFIEITKKDLQADYLIWLLFGDFFDANSDTGLHVLIVYSPRTVLRAGKITKNRLASDCNNNMLDVTVDLADLLQRAQK